MADYRPCMHQAANLHIGRMISSSNALLDSCAVSEDGSVTNMSIDNFLMKLQAYSIIHSCRSLFTLAVDCAVSNTLHDVAAECRQQQQLQRSLQQQLELLKREMAQQAAGEERDLDAVL